MGQLTTFHLLLLPDFAYILSACKAVLRIFSHVSSYKSSGFAGCELLAGIGSALDPMSCYRGCWLSVYKL